MRNLQRFACGAFAAALALLAAGPAAAQIVGTAALVNGSEISNLRLERHFDEYVKGKGRNITKMINPKVYKKLKREALDQLIDKELLWQEARRRGIEVSAEDVAAALREQEAQYKSRDAYLRKLENAGFDEKSYAEYVRREIAIQRCAETAFAPKPVTDADIHEFYVANPDKFRIPEQARARHVLIKLPANADAAQRQAARVRIEDVLAKARKGEDFAELARRYSEDTSASLGGDLGLFARGRMVAPFDEAVFSLKPGKISGVVETEFGYHVVKVEERIPGRVVSEDEARERIRAAMTAARRDEAVREGLKGLRAQAKIQVLVALEDSPSDDRAWVPRR
jgi:parvulin-like peptidyl-prolyl isomerase